ncbi:MULTISPECIES: alpha/beta hydrolase [unclassified Streptomyces]|uniref:alpha/beta hydrolase n=1 Tax=unclassified Streptomyces TaxID=2593676 RepID=UPI001660BDCC|nr:MULTISPECIES: alpha/beta fold hydrolase [unclassified Streptomyces]MBD0709039.1 alpha/beta hydrolase [Streptomyces sp. CBMA291]MBD0715389.1 alpha/beta hydrolase [Streptomyces sp. CBMA370]
MTTFVLVPGAFTGGWVWDEVATLLRAAGAEAHPVTLPGLGGGEAGETPGAGPGITGTARTEAGDGAPGQIGPETHVDFLVRLLDRLAAPDVVLVGHGYGLHPAYAAAGLRPGRVGRIVAVDTPLPQDGTAAGDTLPDPRARMAVDGGTVAPPGPGGWERRGSTEDIPAAALERLERRAVPHPADTLTRPFRPAGEAAGLPVTGLLCTANGSSLDLVRMLVESGPPQFRALADARVSFLELATGHWPMLADPAGLADALLRAAVGEGERMTAPECGPGTDPYDLPFLFEVPEGPRERRGRFDLHLPAGARPGDPPRPAIVFVHGGPVAADRRPTPRDTPFYLGYGRYAASLGAIGVTLDHRLHGLADYPLAADDLAGTVAAVRADPRVDADRIALWFFSAGGLLMADWLAAPPPWLRCLAATYPVLGPLPGWRAVEPRFHPAAFPGTADGPPLVLTRAGREHAVFAERVEEYLTAAARTGAEVEIVDVPEGRHGFELLDRTEESRAAVERAMRSVLARLAA